MEIQKVFIYLCCQRELITLNFNHKNHSGAEYKRRKQNENNKNKTLQV